MIYPEYEGGQRCGKPQAPAELSDVDDPGSRPTGTGALIVLKAACCGVPLLVIALASGAIALSTVLVGAAGLALAGAAVALLGPLVRRRDAAPPVARTEVAGPSARPTPGMPAPFTTDDYRDDSHRAEATEDRPKVAAG